MAYKKMISDYTSKLDQANFGNLNYGRLKEEVDIMIQKIGKEPKDIVKADLDSYTPNSERQKMALRMTKRELDNTTFEKFYEDLEEGVNCYKAQVDEHLNKDYDARNIVGDNDDDATQRRYGKGDVKGRDADDG
ncbi:hypothetical protein B7L30_035380, partial [Burkholderia cenocepacia]|nr:hypothetical protein [Burkholderia cenocepacia]